MGRRQGGTEGSVREDPKGSGSWRARLPARLDPSRKAIPGSFSSATEARRDLNEAIADIDRGRAVKPTPQRRQPTRRLAQVITEYTADRANDGLDPIAVNTIRDYHELLKNVIGKGPDNLGLRPVKDIDSPLLNAWLRDLHRLGIHTLASPRHTPSFEQRSPGRFDRVDWPSTRHVKCDASPPSRAEGDVPPSTPFSCPHGRSWRSWPPIPNDRRTDC